jgi:aminoglycoside phosphotransferase (APT) family kinase protein
MEVNESNVAEYLRAAGRLAGGATGAGEVLVQRLSEVESENVVLKVFDTGGGERIGTDLRSAGQIEAGKPDTRMTQGECVVVKQPREREGARDLARISQERACVELLGGLLPEGSVPEVRWFDETEGVLGMSAAPAEAVNWQKQLVGGTTAMEAATLSGMLLAMLHSSTKKDAAIKERFGDGRVLLAQRMEPLMRATGAKHPAMQKMLQDAIFRMRSPLTLIHGDFRPENILLIPEAPGSAVAAGGGGGGSKAAHVMLVDFETACFGHNALDVAQLVSELLTRGFAASGRWRAMMLLADNFWQTYRHTADPELVRAAEVAGGRLLGALLLARVDGSAAPMKELADRREAQGRMRGLALEILKRSAISLDEAIDEAAMHFDPPQQEEPPKQEAKRHEGHHHGQRRRGHR